MNPDKSSFYKVGKITHAHGIKGEVFVHLFAKEASWMQHMDELYLEQPDKGLSKYEIEFKRPHKNGIIIKAKTVLDRNQAEALKGSLVFVPNEFLVSQPGDMIYLNEILNFKVLDQQRGDVGIITDFSTNGAQDLLVVKNETTQFDVPFVEDFIIKIDFEAHIVHMKLPMGLVPGDEI